jgi:uncharacterized protein
MPNPEQTIKGGVMLRWNHDIYHELPGYEEKIHQLIGQDPHFSHLIDRYHEVNHQLDKIQRHLQGFEATDVALLKRQRLQIKDSLFSQLRAS